MSRHDPIQTVQITVENPRTGALRKIWISLQEPRWITLQTVVAYLTLAGVAGVGGLIDPSPNALHGMGEIVTLWVSVLYALGGLTGAVSAWRGWWGSERGALLFLGGAALIRALNTVWLISLGADGHSTFLGEILCLLIMLKVRWDRIQGAQLDPSR